MVASWGVVSLVLVAVLGFSNGLHQLSGEVEMMDYYQLLLDQKNTNDIYPASSL